MSLTKEQIDSSWRVRATQKTPDDRLTLCGEPAKTDRKGRRCFDIPLHLRDNAYMLGYEISESFNPLLGQNAPGEEDSPSVDISAMLAPAPPVSSVPAPIAVEAPRVVVKSRNASAKGKRKKVVVKQKSATVPVITEQEPAQEVGAEG